MTLGQVELQTKALHESPAPHVCISQQASPACPQAVQRTPSPHAVNGAVQLTPPPQQGAPSVPQGPAEQPPSLQVPCDLPQAEPRATQRL